MQSTAKTVKEYIGELPEERKFIIKTIHKEIKKAVPELTPRMMYGMIAYGTYHYKYASGREGDWALIALASQKNYVSLYLCATEDGKYLAEANKDRLGKVSVGKSCIRFKKLEDIKLDVIKELTKKAALLGESGNFAI